ncbi:MAG TPA: phage integrase N-terminal SAM-like domain-containing protein [Candidatus Binatia bacterium]
MQLSLNDFKQHMIASGKSEHTATLYAQRVAGFLKHLTEQGIEKITEDSARSYVAGIKDKRTKRGTVVAVHQFLKFTVQRPFPVSAEEDEAPLPSTQSQPEVALTQQCLLEKLIDEKRRSDELIAALACKLMDHYLYFQRRIRGGGDSLDNICRLADEAKQLIQSNLALFIRLSSGGRNINRTMPECLDAAAGDEVPKIQTEKRFAR